MLCGAVVLVAMRWAATAILVTLFLMAPLAQFGGVEANPAIPLYYDPTIRIDSPHLYEERVYEEVRIPIKVDVFPGRPYRKFVKIYYSLDGGSNITLDITAYETSSGIFGKGTLANLTDGYHTVEAYSVDTQGNTISDSTTFIVNTTYPTPSSPELIPTPTPTPEPESFSTSLVLASSVTIAVVCIGLGLLVYLIKRK